MYFPYLRGKQYELTALRECADKISVSGKVCPIIEPVRRNYRPLAHTLELYTRLAIPYVLIVNPTRGQFRHSPGAVDELIGNGALAVHKRALPGYIVRKDTNLQQVRGFFKLYDGRHVALFHAGTFADLPRLIDLAQSQRSVLHVFQHRLTAEAYQEEFKRHRRVLIRNCFRSVPNADYPPDEPFTDLHNTYVRRGLRGFGDFTVFGSTYSEGGGQAMAVTLHLTYKHQDGNIWIKHFISDNNSTPGVEEAKFFEALKKLVDFLDANPGFMRSTACDEFREMYRQKRFSNLGYAKKLSMIHHLELMMAVLQ